MARAGAQVEMLRGVSLFSACNDRELRKVGGLCTPISVDAGTVIAKEGAPGREFYTIMDGKATVTLRRKQLAVLGPGDFFGEMSLLDGEPRAATVTAETDMELLVLDPREFSTLIDQYPAVAKKIMKVLGQRLRKVEKAPTH